MEITGPDAYDFIQLLTPRDLSKLSVGQCKYVLIINADGGILNDPILLRLGENHFWLSLGDSDILLWAQGVAINSGFVWPKNQSLLTNKTIIISILKPIGPNLIKAEFLNLLENNIYSELDKIN